MNKTIGIFDSGAGGLSIWKSKINYPNESAVYILMQNMRLMDKGKKAILKRSLIIQILLNKGAKIVVVACNTATTNAISLKKSCNVLLLELNAIKPAALNTKTNCIGILATQGTLQWRLFRNFSTLQKYKCY